MSDRVLQRLDELYAIGGGPGANRIGFSRAEQEAHDLVRGWMEEAGLDVTVDPAGNLFGRLRGTTSDRKELWTGSHLDTVPNGGRFDGALGVVAGLEAVERLGAQPRTIAVVAFREEEGSRFGRGCFGSRALCGRLRTGELEHVDQEGASIADVVRSVGLGPIPEDGWLEPPAAFFELHVEQGPVLDSLGAPLGIVDSVVGLARLRVTFSGHGGHSGTTPMLNRRDALVTAAGFVLTVKQAAEAHEGAVATVGRITVEPNAANVVPSRVDLLVDARARDSGTLAALVRDIEGAAGDARVHLGQIEPVELDTRLRAELREVVAELGLLAPQVPSGAGHDAGVLASAGVPAAMLFVRSRAGGISHSPDEHSDDVDITLGVDALERVLRRLSSR